jgi:hypothetical protein
MIGKATVFGKCITDFIREQKSSVSVEAQGV